MRINSGAACCALIAALMAPAHVAAQVSGVSDLAELADSLARAYMSDGHVRGMTIAVAASGQDPLIRAYGIADVEAGADAGPNTVYYITSITKQFTAASVLRLAEQGALSLDDPITKFLPDYPVQGRDVRVRHLLNHTFGIADYAYEHPDLPQWHRLDVSYREMVDLWGSQPFVSSPGERYAYNNLGYYLLGEWS